MECSGFQRYPYCILAGSNKNDAFIPETSEAFILWWEIRVQQLLEDNGMCGVLAIPVVVVD